MTKTTDTTTATERSLEERFANLKRHAEKAQTRATVNLLAYGEQRTRAEAAEAELAQARRELESSKVALRVARMEIELLHAELAAQANA